MPGTSCGSLADLMQRRGTPGVGFLLEQAAAVAREQGDNSWDEAQIESNLSRIYIGLGRYQQAEKLLRKHLRLFRERGDMSSLA